jgi:hypothetical protein
MPDALTQKIGKSSRPNGSRKHCIIFAWPQRRAVRSGRAAVRIATARLSV